MIFNHAYYHTMDRGYYVGNDEVADQDLQITPEAQEAETKLGAGEIGFGSNPFVHPTQGIQARIKEGVGYIDIPFFGAGKGNKERYTPESISKKEREDIRELAEINKVKLSTHASTNIQGLAGYHPQQGFNQEMREQTLKEIKKAIDFAADLQGGAIVFHTGEFPRPFSEQKWNKDKMFMNFPEEEKEAVLHMVDNRSGETVGVVRKSIDVYEPDWETFDHDGVDKLGNPYKAGDFMDIDGNVVDTKDMHSMLRRKPKWDAEREEFKFLKRDWDYFSKKAEENGKTPEHEYFFTKTQEQLLRSKGSSLFYTQRYEDDLRQEESIKKAIEYYKDLDEKLPEEEKWRMLKTEDVLPYDLRGMGIPFGSKEKPVLDILQERLVMVQRHLKHAHEASSSFDTEAETVKDRIDHTIPIAEYGMEKSADTIARAAEFAWQKTRQEKTERPIYVSPESYLPGFYGSHPDEISEIIDTSRNSMVQMLTGDRYKMSESRAKKIASEHIKGTLDSGHFNLWRQHFNANPGESPAQTDKRFNKWYLDKVGGLIKDGKIGQVHVTDNMGYDDEHLAPGEGNVPIKEVMKMVEEAGIKDVIVEAGSFNATRIVGDTLSYFGSPVYQMSRGPSFGQFHEQHFGYTGPPFYVVGAYSPSNDWKLWSEVQLE